MIYPAFRFWVPQSTATGADEGRTVDDLTASGGNCQTCIKEKLQLPSLDDFVAMCRQVAQMFPERKWGFQVFLRQDMRKAFRQVPGCPHSRQWGAFAVRNPDTQLIELFQHLSLPFGARAAPLLFCAVARILCELAAFHLGVPSVAFVDDFFSVVPSSIAATVFNQFKWFVIGLLGFRLKTEKESPPKSADMLFGVWVNLLPGGNGEFFLPDDKRLKSIQSTGGIERRRAHLG